MPARRAWLLAVLLALGLSACGGSKQEGGPAVTWVLDPAETVRRMPEETQAWAKKQLEGLSVTLEFTPGGPYHLTVAGGPAPGESSGSWKSGFGQMILQPTKVDGKPAPAGTEIHLRSPDQDHLVLLLGGLQATLRRK